MILASDLGASARLVAFVLSTHMNAAGGSCFPSLTTISRESGYARSTVCDALSRLERARLIERVRGGPHRPTRYRATSPLTGLPVVRSSDWGSPVIEPEDVQEDVHTSLRANARRRKGARSDERAQEQKLTERKWTR